LFISILICQKNHNSLAAKTSSANLIALSCLSFRYSARDVQPTSSPCLTSVTPSRSVYATDVSCSKLPLSRWMRRHSTLPVRISYGLNPAIDVLFMLQNLFETLVETASFSGALGCRISVN
jgi:hypothetical protein